MCAVFFFFLVQILGQRCEMFYRTFLVPEAISKPTQAGANLEQEFSKSDPGIPRVLSGQYVVKTAFVIILTCKLPFPLC